MMKKILLLFLLLYAVSTITFGQSWRSPVLPTGAPETLVDIEYANSGLIYLTGNLCGITCTPTMRKSIDGGRTWTQLWAGIPYWDFYQHTEIEFPNADIGYFLAASNDTTVMYKTYTGGLSWTQVYTNGPQAFGTSGLWIGGAGKLYFHDSNFGFLIGDHDKIVRTTDGGSNWSTQSLGNGIELLSIRFVDTNTGYATGFDQNSGITALLFKTTNGGVTWNVQHSLVGEAFTSVSFEGNTGYLTGKNLYKSTDGGVTWQQNLAGPTLSSFGYFSEVEFSSLQVGTVVGPDSGAFYRTFDGGQNWIQQDPNSTYLYGIDFLDDIEGGVIGEQIAIYLTEVGGVQCTTACVWPGDANNDQIVNNQDLFNIGIGAGASGGARPNASLLWTGQSAPAWSQSFTSGENYKYADCDGNGIIDSLDNAAILANYSLTHNKGTGLDKAEASAPLLYAKFPVDSLLSGQDSLRIPIFLGTVDNPAEDVYGIAFTLHYAEQYADTHEAVVDYASSWLCNGTESISLSIDFRNQGTIETAHVCADGQNRSGYGQVCNRHCSGHRKHRWDHRGAEHQF